MPKIATIGTIIALSSGLFSWAGASTAFAKPLPSPEEAPLPTPQGGDGTYHQEYFINNLPKYSTNQVMSQFNSNVDAYFTYTGCGLHLSLNQICQLNTPIGNAPVQVVGLSLQGFAFKALAGHPEGADRMIEFQFKYATLNGLPRSKMLVVDAWGPTNWFSGTAFNRNGVAGYSWQTMANNINSRFPQDPPCDPDIGVSGSCPV
jgi:hypothetical protein